VSNVSTLIVMAKAPIPGQVHARLCPPCSLSEAALVAEAALRDTLEVAESCGVTRLVVALEDADAEVPSWFSPDVEVIRQRRGNHNVRIAGAIEDVIGDADENTLLVGAETPQISSDWLGGGFVALESGAEAVLGLTADGGYWLVGLRRANQNAFEGIPMNTPNTGSAQRERMESLGLRLAVLPDTFSVSLPQDLDRLCAEYPDLRASNVWRALRTHAAAS
jgi:uncharacterized protein